MGEKGRAQLVRVERNKILATVNDVNKLRITFAQVSVLSQNEALHDACCSWSALCIEHTSMHCISMSSCMIMAHGCCLQQWNMAGTTVAVS